MEEEPGRNVGLDWTVKCFEGFCVCVLARVGRVFEAQDFTIGPAQNSKRSEWASVVNM